MGTSLNDINEIIDSDEKKSNSYLVASTIGSLYCCAGVIWTIALTYRHYCYILEMYELEQNQYENLEINSDDAKECMLESWSDEGNCRATL